MNKTINKHGGSLKISNDVIVKVAEIAATEITGVAAEGQSLVVIDKGIASKFFNPIKVTLAGETAEIEINIVVIKDYKVTAVAENVQESVKSAVQSMTGITVSKVNVNIVGVKNRVNDNA